MPKRRDRDEWLDERYDSDYDSENDVEYGTVDAPPRGPAPLAPAKAEPAREGERAAADDDAAAPPSHYVRGHERDSECFFPDPRQTPAERAKWDDAVQRVYDGFVAGRYERADEREKPFERNELTRKLTCYACRTWHCDEFHQLFQHCESKARQGRVAEWRVGHMAMARYIALNIVNAKEATQQAVAHATVAPQQRALSRAEHAQAVGASRPGYGNFVNLNTLKGDDFGELAWPPTVLLEDLERAWEPQSRKYVSVLGGNVDLRKALLGEEGTSASPMNDIKPKLHYNMRGFTGLATIQFPETWEGYSTAKQLVLTATREQKLPGRCRCRIMMADDLATHGWLFDRYRLPVGDKTNPFKSYRRMSHAVLLSEKDKEEKEKHDSAYKQLQKQKEEGDALAAKKMQEIDTMRDAHEEQKKKDQEELEARIQKMREEHAMKDAMKELDVRLDAASFLLVGVFVRAWQGH